MASRHAHTRRGSGRAPITRRTTRGPLDEDDPLSATSSTLESPMRSNLTSPIDTPPLATDSRSPILVESALLPAMEPKADIKPKPVKPDNKKDLSFLLDPSIYHSLSQLETAPPFRHPFPPVPSRTTPMAASFSQLDSLLAKCDFLSAAHLSASILSSGAVSPTDVKTVFELIGLRYSCLELSGNVLLAAQEAKALEDLTSSFYYLEPTPDVVSAKAPTRINPPLAHIMPFSLRLQALRLQSIGFSDPRRGVSALYELGLECREHISSPGASPEDTKIWNRRLQEVGIRVVNCLVEMGDLDCATRTLASMKPEHMAADSLWVHQLALAYIRMGDLIKAHEILAGMDGFTDDENALKPLLAVAEGRYEDAVELWENHPNNDDALVKQNLAVAYLYSGKFQDARSILEDLIEAGHNFKSLTINLATVYELTSDKSRELKMSLAGKISKQQKDMTLSQNNVDFKL